MRVKLNEPFKAMRGVMETVGFSKNRNVKKSKKNPIRGNILGSDFFTQRKTTDYVGVAKKTLVSSIVKSILRIMSRQLIE